MRTETPNRRAIDLSRFGAGISRSRALPARSAITLRSTAISLRFKVLAIAFLPCQCSGMATAARGQRRRRLTRIDAIVREVLAEMRAEMAQCELAAEYSTPTSGRTADEARP